MNCPTCGSPLNQGKTKKGAVFLTCSNWPRCKVSGTPELFEAFQKPAGVRGPVHIRESIVGVAQLAIHLSKLKQAKTKEDREAIRKQALEALK